MTVEHPRPRPRLRALVIAPTALAAAMLAASCSGSSTVQSSTGSTAAPPAPAGTSAAPAATKPAGPAKITVKAKDYAFEGLPSTMAVGSELALENTSAKEVHEMVVFRLPDTEKRSAKELASLPMADLQKALAGAPTMVLVAPPSKPGFNAVGDGTIGKPGRYIAICSIPTGADPNAYMAAAAQSKGGPVSVPGGPPHMAEGMYAEFTVQ